MWNCCFPPNCFPFPLFSICSIRSHNDRCRILSWCHNYIWKFNRNSLTIEKSPDKTQTMSAIFTLPVCIKTPVGDTKMPDPMIEPTITVHPLSRLIFALRPTSPSPSAPFWLPSVGELPLLASNGKFSSREPLRFWFTSVFVIIFERFAIQH